MLDINNLIGAGLGYCDALLVVWPSCEKSAFTDEECEWVWRNSPIPADSEVAWNVLLSRAKTFGQLVKLWGIIVPGDDLEGEREWNLILDRFQERFDVWNALKASAVNFDQKLFLLRKARNHTGEMKCLWSDIDPDQAETSEQRKAYWALNPEINSQKRARKLKKLQSVKNKKWTHWLQIWEMFDSNAMGGRDAWKELSNLATTREEKIWLVEHAPDKGYKGKVMQDLRRMTES